jgi:outer membrane protein assembly factor BamB
VSLWPAADTRAQSASWPQWRGPSRDGVAPGPAPANWPATLTQRWKVPVGSGYSTPIVADGRVFIHARTAERETVTAFDAASGRHLWQDGYDAAYKVNPAAASHGPGPKSSPVYAGGRVYTYGISGIISAYDAGTGKVVWRKQPSTEQPHFGVAMSPLVTDGVVVVFVGGHERGALMGLDVASGVTRWQWTGGAPAYASPMVATLAGVKQIVTQSRTHVVGVSLTGTLLWEVPLTTPYDQNSVTPVVANDLVIYAGLSNPTTAVRVGKDGDRLVPKEVWKNPDVPMYMSTAVVAGQTLIGLGQRNRGQFFAVDIASGRTLWTTKGRETENAALIRIPGHTLIQTTEGELIVAKDSATGFEVVKRYDVADSSTWAHPALVGNQLYVRDANSLTAWTIG